MTCTRRFPHRLVRWTSLCVCFAFVLSFLAVVPFSRATVSLAQGLGSPNGQGTTVRAVPPLPGPPAVNWPNLDQVRTRPQLPPQAPMPLPSSIRSRRSPLEPRNGRRVGDPGTTLISGSAGVPPAERAERAQTPAHKEASVRAGALKANEMSALLRGQLRMISKHNHARARAGTPSPSPIGDAQYVQTFFTWALARSPIPEEQTYWYDILRVAYSKGQTSMVMGARELGKTLFESSDYADRNRNDHWYVYDLYQSYLLRAPDSGGWAYWESQVPLIGREATRRAFDESGEFISVVSTITPNGSASSAVSSLLTARVDPNNQPGGGLLTRDATWGVSLLSLPGRAGLDLGLGLSYSSAVWTRSGPVGGPSRYIYFDEDDGWPSPGFRLGFPTIQEKFFDAQVAVNAYLMIASSGRVELRQMGTSNVYEAADSSYLQLTDNGTSLLLRTTDGTQMNYAKYQDEWRCTQIKDRNGNYLSVSYDWLGHISSITDTLGRVITVTYDSKANQTSITQTWNGQTHTWATFGWGTVNIQTSFSGVEVSGAPNGTIIPVLTMVGFHDGTYCKFLYNSAAQMTRVTNYADDLDSNPATDNHPRNYTAFDYGAADDNTRLIATRVWAEWLSGPFGVDSEVTSQFSLPGDGSHQMTAPDNTGYKEFYGTGWQKGLITQSEVWSGGVRQKWTTITRTQDNPGVSYQTNPRVTDSDVYDAAYNHRRSRVDYYAFTLPSGASCNLPSDSYQYAADAATVLRRTHTDYNLSSTYLNRHIIGLTDTQSVYDGANNLVAKAGMSYDETALQNQGTTVQHDDTNYGASYISGRANLTSARRYDVVNTANSTTSSVAYNTAGSAVSTTDPLSHQISISYADSFSADGVNATNLSFATWAYPTTLTDADGKSSTIKYHYDFGASTRAQGPDVNQTLGLIQIYTYDAAARLLQTTTSNNGAYTRNVYTANSVQTFSTINDVTHEAYSVTFLNGLGQVVAAAKDNPGSTGGYAAQMTYYDNMGRVRLQSNPTEITGIFVPAGDDAAGWFYTQQTYDWKGRPLVTTNPDGTPKSASYSACGCAGSEVTTLSDEGTLVNGVVKYRQQKIYSDVLGRAAKTEVLNWDGSVYSTTANIYNARDQITKVNQYQGAAPGDLSCPANDGLHGTDTSWKQTLTPGSGWQNVGFNDSSWPSTVDEGAYGGSPWGSSPSFPTGTPAHWIWYYDSRSSGDSSTVYFRKTFVARINSAVLTLRADDNSVAYLNGVQVASTSNWQQVQTATLSLTPGTTYVLAIQVTNNGGPGGLVADVYSGGNSCQQTTMGYDSYGRLKTQHRPEQQIDPNNPASTDHTTWDYNADDTIQKITDARGAHATHVYNNRHLVTGITYGVLSGVPTTGPSAVPSSAAVTFQYDNAGNRTSMSDGEGSTSYNYNQLSRLTSETRHINGLAGLPTGGNYTLTYQYNLAGELSNITDPWGAQVGYNRDVVGRTTAVTSAGYGNITMYASNFQYRAWGAVKHITYGFGRTLDVSYNSRLQPATFAVSNVSPQPPQVISMNYQYFNDGNLRYSQDVLNSRFDRSYSYDHAGRMTQALSGPAARGEPDTDDRPYIENFSFDVWDNLTTRLGRHWSHGKGFGGVYVNNRMDGWQYDADGHVTVSNSVTSTFDAAGRPVQTVGPQRRNNPPLTLTQGFDGAGLRVRETEYGASWYWLYSSALGGKPVSKIYGSPGTTEFGWKWRGYVYANGVKLAEQNPTIYYEAFDVAADPSGVVLFDPEGGQLDPLGDDVGFDDPYLHQGGDPGFNYPVFGDATDGGGGCIVDGTPWPCTMAFKYASAVRNVQISRIGPYAWIDVLYRRVGNSSPNRSTPDGFYGGAILRRVPGNASRLLGIDYDPDGNPIVSVAPDESGDTFEWDEFSGVLPQTSFPRLSKGQLGSIRKAISGLGANKTCKDFLKKTLKQLGQSFNKNILSIFDAAAKKGGLYDSSGDPSAQPGYTAIGADSRTPRIEMNLSLISSVSSDPNALVFAVVHELFHAAMKGGAKYTHTQMAGAADTVGRSMGFVPSVLAGPKEFPYLGSKQEQAEVDAFNSNIFDKRLYDACFSGTK
jgi:YD repeat-containing protein